MCEMVRMHTANAAAQEGSAAGIPPTSARPCLAAAHAH